MRGGTAGGGVENGRRGSQNREGGSPNGSDTEEHIKDGNTLHNVLFRTF